MLPYSIKEDILTNDDKVFLQKLDTILDAIPEKVFRHPHFKDYMPITCHHIAHALSQVFPEYRAVDGRFGEKGLEHSRLESKNADYENGRIIIDAYPIGGVRPHMIYKFAGGPRNQIFQECTEEERKQLNLGLLVSQAFIEQVECIQADILEILNKKK